MKYLKELSGFFNEKNVEKTKNLFKFILEHHNLNPDDDISVQKTLIIGGNSVIEVTFFMKDEYKIMLFNNITYDVYTENFKNEEELTDIFKRFHENKIEWLPFEND